MSSDTFLRILKWNQCSFVCAEQISCQAHLKTKLKLIYVRCAILLSRPADAVVVFVSPKKALKWHNEQCMTNLSLQQKLESSVDCDHLWNDSNCLQMALPGRCPSSKTAKRPHISNPRTSWSYPVKCIDHLQRIWDAEQMAKNQLAHDLHWASWSSDQLALKLLVCSKEKSPREAKCGFSVPQNL